MKHKPGGKFKKNCLLVFWFEVLLRRSALLTYVGVNGTVAPFIIDPQTPTLLTPQRMTHVGCCCLVGWADTPSKYYGYIQREILTHNSRRHDGLCRQKVTEIATFVPVKIFNMTQMDKHFLNM